jgi:hypothetical protein
MAFIMRFCAVLKHYVTLFIPVKYFLSLLVVFISLQSLANTPGYFIVHRAHTQLQENVYRLNATFEYNFNNTLKEALLNGVALTVVVLIEVKRERQYWLDAQVATIRQRYKLSYQGLTQQYVIYHINTGLQENFNSLSAALDTLREIKELPLLDTHLVTARQRHKVHIQTYLDIETLPPPLQPVAYFSKDWRISSNEYICSLSE